MILSFLKTSRIRWCHFLPYSYGTASSKTRRSTWSSSCLSFCAHFASLSHLPHDAPPWSSHVPSYTPNLFLTQGPCTCFVLCLMFLLHPLFPIPQASANVSLQNCFPDCLPRGTHPTPFPSHSPCSGLAGPLPDDKKPRLCRASGLGHSDAPFLSSQESCYRPQMNEWAWACPNKTLLMGPDIAISYHFTCHKKLS